MTIRFQRILEEFPEIPQDHILIGSRKDKIDVDILFDDGMHNVANSTAAYPILMRRPWNHEATGMLAVNTYDEFLKLVEVIADSYSPRLKSHIEDAPGIVVLVGPSGSGKTDIAKQILKKSRKFEKLISYTTDATVGMEGDDWYHYISLDAFRQMRDGGEIFESTMYAGHNYGSKKEDIENILTRGHHVLTVMDICGAMALKTHFPNVITIYTKRDKKDLLTAIVERDMPTEDKVNRLLAIEGEKQNADICDYVVKVDSYEQAAREICASLQLDVRAEEMV
jgi:guanylate kinase